MDQTALRSAFRFKAIGNFIFGLSASAAVMGPVQTVPTLMDQWSNAAQIQTFAQRFSETRGTDTDYHHVQARLVFEHEGPLSPSIGHCYATTLATGPSLHKEGRKWPFLACLGNQADTLQQAAGTRASITIMGTFVFAVGGLVGFAMARGAGRVMRRELGPKPD